MYDRRDFCSKVGDTITAPEGICEKIGQRVKASEEDIQQVNYWFSVSVSGARSRDRFLENPCTQDCPCWEGMSGCNGRDSNACQGGLFCNSRNQYAPVPPDAPTPAPFVAPVSRPALSGIAIVHFAPLVYFQSKFAVDERSSRIVIRIQQNDLRRRLCPHCRHEK